MHGLNAIPSAAQLAVRTVAIALAACTALAGCAAGTSGSRHYTPVDFRAYETFAWATDGGLIGSEDTDPHTTAMIRDAVERELGQRGLRPAGGPDEADLLLAFTLGSRSGVGPDAYPERLRGPWRWRGLDVARDAGYAPDTLAIDLFDRAAGQPVWHGWARQPTGDDTVRPEDTMAATVEAVLRRYPPRRGAPHSIHFGGSYGVFGQ